jgi:hypothetical protein
MTSNIRKGSMLFGQARQFLARNKSTFVYEKDLTFSQRWVQKQIVNQQRLQKIYGVSKLQETFHYS